MNQTNAPIIFGLEGTEITHDEREFFKEHLPLGIVLFLRNCESPGQLKKLIADVKQCYPDKLSPIISIDQEGGRVARLKKPHWQEFPPAAYFAELAQEKGLEFAYQACYDNYAEIAVMLGELGFNMNYAPVLDLHYEYTDEVIGSRAFSDDIGVVAKLGDAAYRAMADKGVTPVIKHIPGHGRARCDSHKDLPIVDCGWQEICKTDLAPFTEIIKQHNPQYAMLAHIKFSDLSGEVSTFCPKVIARIRRDSGFSGRIVSDDLSMEALSGSIELRAERALRAGCDILLHCNGKIAEMHRIIEAIAAR